MPIQNKTMLITYSDSLGNNLKDLYENLEKYFGDAVGGVHLLPFFPSTGDRGFAPVDYDQVDPAFGDWEDVKRLGDKYYLMFDFMINHILESRFKTRSGNIKSFQNQRALMIMVVACIGFIIGKMMRK